MAGTIYKRCRSCGRKVTDRVCSKPGCEEAEFSWAFSISLGTRADGRPRRVLRSGFRTKREAQAALDDIRTNTADRHVRPRNLTLEDYLVGRWLPRLRTTEKTRRDRAMHMRAYVIPRLGSRRLIDVTGDDLTEMYEDLLLRGRTTKPDPELGMGLSPTTVRRIHVQLNKAFNDAIRWELLLRNPCQQADPPSANEVKARALAARKIYTWDQLRTFMDEASTDRLHGLWHLLVATGMRRSEAVALRWEHVDLGQHMISVVRSAVETEGQVHEHELPKSSSSRRRIELHEIDVGILRDHQRLQDRERQALGDVWRGTGHVFTSHVGGRLYPPDVTRWFHQITDRAGLPRIRIHDLRHTHATLLLKAGVPTKVVTERLGHSTTAYTQDAYQHVMPGMQRDAANYFHTAMKTSPNSSAQEAEE